jgi:hypothetical protein
MVYPWPEIRLYTGDLNSEIRGTAPLINNHCIPQQLEESIGYLVGDCLMAAAFLSYAGPFLSQYRDELVQDTWLKQVGHAIITTSKGDDPYN